MPAASEMLGRLQSLLALAQAQGAALEAADGARFETLLDAREALLGDLTELEHAVLASPPEAQARALALLAEIASIDGKNEATLAAQLGAVRAELPALDAGRRAAAAYRPAVDPAAYVDKAS
jgi:hypothetical protein